MTTVGTRSRAMTTVGTRRRAMTTVGTRRRAMTTVARAVSARQAMTTAATVAGTAEANHKEPGAQAIDFRSGRAGRAAAVGSVV
jgi:hypothetical protein